MSAETMIAPGFSHPVFQSQAAFQRPQVGDEAVCGFVGVATAVAGAEFVGAGDVVVEALEHAHQELPERLARVARGDRTALAAFFQRQHERVAE